MLHFATQYGIASFSVNSADVYIGIAVADCGPDACCPYDPLISVHQNTPTPTPALHELRGLSVGSDDDLMLMACDPPQPQLPATASVPLQPQLLPPPQGGDPDEPWDFGSLRSSLSQLPATGKTGWVSPFSSACEFSLQAASLVLSFPV